LEVLALELARAQAQTVETLVLSLDGEREEALSAWPRLRAQSDQLLFAAKRPGVDPWLVGRLIRLFRARQVRCVHTHHVGPLIYAGAAARLAGVGRRIHTEHDAWHLADLHRRRLVKMALRIARPTVVADAPHVASAVRDALHCAAPLVVLNGVDTKRFAPADRAVARQAFGLGANTPVIGVAARLEPVKGVDIALDAFARLEPPARLLIAGDGSQMAALVGRAAALGIEGRVDFIGLVNDMPAFFRALDVFCLPSRAEGLPLSLLEAQACGVCVVASDVGGVAAAVGPLSGILVEGENVEALASALRSALHEARGNPGPVAAARDFVVRNASLDTAAQAYLDLALKESG
jgi:glycosyltransferase involved in cell wall biosynthesis